MVDTRVVESFVKLVKQMSAIKLRANYLDDDTHLVPMLHEIFDHLSPGIAVTTKVDLHLCQQTETKGN